MLISPRQNDNNFKIKVKNIKSLNSRFILDNKPSQIKKSK